MFDPALLDLPLYESWPRFTLRRLAIGIAWLLCAATAWQRLDHSLCEFDRDDRPPTRIRSEFAVADASPPPKGNAGHAQIDFGGQWLMGRMIVTGQGRHLYDRNHHWKALRDGYPAERDPELARKYAFPVSERPAVVNKAEHKAEDFRTDAENLMSWTMGNKHDCKRRDELGEGIALALAGGVDGNPFSAAVAQQLSKQKITPELIEELERPSLGGPLYPPVHGFLYAPLGALDPQTAYFFIQLLGIAACFASGWAAQSFSRGRLAWPVCTTVILLFPGFRPGLDLGQNHAISLAILLIGWALVVRGREYLGGATWGLLAFKPVWGIVFVLVPLMMLRWRVVLAMGLIGCGWALATLPVVGIQTWENWLSNSKEATSTYNVNKNWIELSRDLSGLPKRILLDFDKPQDERADSSVELLGWILWGVVLAATLAIYRFRAERSRPTGLGAGFLFLGLYHCCYRFMYYDVVLAAAGVFVMLAHPGLLFSTARFKLLPAEDGPFARRARLYFCSIPLLILALLLWNENGLMNLRPRATVGADYFAVATKTAEGKATTHTPTLSATSDYFHPVDTVLLLLLWGWAGWRLLRDGDYPRSASSAAPMSGERISDSPTSTA